MAMNPLAYAENVVRGFLRYQLTAYPFADPDLYGQMRRLLSLTETRRTPLLKGPYISLSQAIRQGAAIRDLVRDRVLHAHMSNLVPYERVYAHQEIAMLLKETPGSMVPVKFGLLRTRRPWRS